MCFDGSDKSRMFDFLSKQISSEPQIFLRRAQSDDFEFINEVQYSEMKDVLKKAWKNKFSFKAWFYDVEEAAKGAFHKVFIVEVQKSSIGYLWLNREPQNLWITAIVLQTDWQRRGIGEKIMHYLIGECREEQLNAIELGVQHNNERALNFYKKIGFKQYDHLKEANTDLLRHEFKDI